MLEGLFGNSNAPRYTMSPQYKQLTFGTTYPKLEEIIKSGGVSLDTAGLERGFKENTAANFGGAFDKVRAFTAPYGNPAAGNRLALRIAGQQAGEESRGISHIRTTAGQEKIRTLMDTLGISSGLEDPNLKAYFAELARYEADQQRRTQTAGLFGNLAGLGATWYLGGPAAGIARMAGGMYTGAGSGSYGVNLPANPYG